jgi:hypothetical protein
MVVLYFIVVYLWQSLRVQKKRETIHVSKYLIIFYVQKEFVKKVNYDKKK